MRADGERACFARPLKRRLSHAHAPPPSSNVISAHSYTPVVAPWSGVFHTPTGRGRVLRAVWEGACFARQRHVHVLFRPLGSHRLGKIMSCWKGFTGYEIRRQTGTSGRLWQKEYWDRLIRNPEHYWRCVEYIRENPGRAGWERGSLFCWRRWNAGGYWGCESRRCNGRVKHALSQSAARTTTLLGAKHAVSTGRAKHALSQSAPENAKLATAATHYEIAPAQPRVGRVRSRRERDPEDPEPGLQR